MTSAARKAFRTMGALVQILAVSAFCWAAWDYHPTILAVCNASWPLSLTAILCGRAPPFLYGSLAVGAFEGVVIALLIALLIWALRE